MNDLADRLAAAIGVAVLRVAGIARQVVVGVFRGTLRAAYQAPAPEGKPEVIGWWWRSRQDRTTCGVCWARHGTVYPLDAPLVSHRHCRCVPVPLKRGDPRPGTGAALFARLSEEDRRNVLGPGKAALYESGRLNLGALVTETDDPRHGPGLRETTLRELVA